MRAGVALGYDFAPGDVVVFLTLVLLEGVLSFDNAAVLAAMVRRLPVELRRKALLYGLVGAYTFRTLAILGVAYLVRYPILKLIGGLYLLYLAVVHMLPRPHQRHAGGGLLGRLGMSPFWSVVVGIEVADLVFAMDQVIVAVALTDKLVLIIAASLVAILFLRLSAAYIARLMDWFPPLERLAYVAVGFVGLKLVAVEVVHRLGHTEFEVPKWVTVGLTLALLAGPLLGKLVVDRVRRSRAAPE